MSVHSRYRNYVKPFEVKAPASRKQELKQTQTPGNRHQRRAIASAAASKRKLLVTRSGR